MTSSRLSLRAILAGLATLVAVDVLLAISAGTEYLIYVAPAYWADSATNPQLTFEEWVLVHPSALVLLSIIAAVGAAIPAYVTAYVAKRAFVLNAVAVQAVLIPLAFLDRKAFSESPLLQVGELVIVFAVTILVAKLREFQALRRAR